MKSIRIIYSKFTDRISKHGTKEILESIIHENHAEDFGKADGRQQYAGKAILQTLRCTLFPLTGKDCPRIDSDGTGTSGGFYRLSLRRSKTLIED